MADISMPRLSDTMEEGTIATWLKKPGEQISKGEVIAQIETDKATMDLTAFEAGTLQEILAPEGTTVAIGQPVARIGGGNGSTPAPEAATDGAEAGATTSQPPGAASTDSVQPATQAKKQNVPDAREPTAKPAKPSAAQPTGKPAKPSAAQPIATPAESSAAQTTGKPAKPSAAQPTATPAESSVAEPTATPAESSAAEAPADESLAADTAEPAVPESTATAAKSSANESAAAEAPADESLAADTAEPAVPESTATAAKSSADESSAAEAPAVQSAPQRPGGQPGRAQAALAANAARGGEAEPTPDDRRAEGKVRASPMARHLAAEHGLELAAISGSGPQGRVIRSDVEAALGSQQPAAGAAEAPASGAAETPADGAAETRADAAAQTPADGAAETRADGGTNAGQAQASTPAADQDDERVSLSQMRRTIARRMAESTRTVPHFFLTTTVDATQLVALRKQIVEQIADEGVKITFNDLIVKGAALAVRKVPEVNVSFAEDSLIRHQRVHIGVAVATARGLIVPVLRDADQKSLGQIARETRDLAERANAGKLQPAEYTGGTFTISNLGMFGVEQFSAVINTPEAAILAIGAITREPAEHEGEISLRERLKLTLSVDHRALDGAIGARYLQALTHLLETPMLLLL